MWRALLFSLFLWIAGVARATGAEVLTIPFLWSAGELQGRTVPHAVMLVPLDTRNKRGPFLQFDSGAQQSLVYSWARADLQRSGMIANSGTSSTASAAAAQGTSGWSIELRGYGAQTRIGVREIDHGAEGGPVGTLGADFLAGSLLVIDYARQRIFLVRGEGQARTAQCLFREAVRPVDIELIGNRVGLPVKVAGKELGPVLFDTGTSGFGLVLFDRSTWNAMASASPPPKTTVVAEENSLQGTVSIASKLIDGDLCLGDVCIHRPDVGSVGFEAVPAFIGTIGNREFGSGFVVLDYVQRKALFSRAPFGTSKRKCVQEAIRQAQSTKGKG